ncbi:MAG: PH domain-containing protein [Nanoarchaeota archaeon]
MKQQLHPGVKWAWRVSSYLGSLFLVLFFGIWLGVFVGAFVGKILLTAFIIAVGLFLLLVIFTEIWIPLAYNRWFYEFTDTNLKIEYGVIWKTYKNIPYERIQNVDIHRGIIARMLGFSSINIQTAGYSGGYSRRGYGGTSEGSIPAVDMAEAEKIRDFVIKKISGKKSGI